eukprot:TRINITY_DN4362_c0_g1_i2.p2 TRINITY_DN4362_c0_g1~~TRINITY_DN4362_c0_g1_i2.p2  ORF type:complete len:141 (+),score=47.37 TRINITY_DN4362_c0_g1_i2:606-1028(+)
MSSSSSSSVNDLIKEIVSGNADVNETNEKGETLLHTAAANGQMGLVATLDDAGADLEARDDRGNTPLDLALKNGKIKVVKYLHNASIKRTKLDCLDQVSDNRERKRERERKSWNLQKFFFSFFAFFQCKLISLTFSPFSS